MRRNVSVVRFAIGTGLALLFTYTPGLPGAALAQNSKTAPHGGMIRFPDVSATHIVFVYAADLWSVPRGGGMATPLASPPGEEQFPRFSRDGNTIAFMGNYDGNRDIYTLPLTGGVPTRVTHHPGAEILNDWTPDGRLLFYTDSLGPMSRQQLLFTVAAGGGLPLRVPVPFGTIADISPDGQWLAYTPHTSDFRTWKRYRGGRATDIWLFNLTDKSARKITDWEGTDTAPMWQGNTLYYLSDAGPEHRLNIWSFEIESGKREQLTTFRDFDVKWPAHGPGPSGAGEIVMQYGSQILLLDLANPVGPSNPRTVEIQIPGDRPTIKPQRVDVSKLIENADISPSGKRVVFDARGDIWSLPAERGAVRNLTRSSGVAERDPAWSPDGRWIAYFSDATGEYELYLTQSDGQGDTRQLTRDGAMFRLSPSWSPDSKHIAFTDKSGALNLHSIDSGQTRTFDREPWGNGSPLNWSPDSKWIVYTKGMENRLNAIWVYSLDTQQPQQLTSGMFADSWPTFDRKGDYLYFASQRSFSAPIYEDIGTTFVYAMTDRLYVAPLRKDVKSPLLAKSDEEKWGDEKSDKKSDGADEKDAQKPDGPEEKSDSEKKPGADEKKSGTAAKSGSEKPDEAGKKGDKAPPKPVTIDVAGFEARVEELPVPRGSFSQISVNKKGHLIYVRQTLSDVERKSSVRILDLEDDKREEKTVIDEVGAFRISADGEKLLVRAGDRWGVISAAAGQKLETPVPLGELFAQVDPRQEWQQLFDDAWRMQRDYFYDPGLHAVDWKALKSQYGAMLADCVSREDVGYVISEMISELNVGHAYYIAPPDGQPAVSVGLLGCDFELRDGVYIIARIYCGADWDADARNPLQQAGVDVKVGDALLAVNGVQLDPTKDPWAAFQGLAEKVVTLTIRDGTPATQPATAPSTQPSRFPGCRDVVVKLLASEGNLRYRDWIERNRKYVAEKTAGRVGYIHVPDTGVNGQNNLFRQFFGQIEMPALIIDERWNGGGQIPTRFVELLNRPRLNYWARRDGRDWPWPPDGHPGPKCMLINGLAGSGGDAFPHYFKEAKLGKLIGTRTWGGLVGISGNPRLIDGTNVTAPTFAFYERDGTWGIEGHGVDPDIEVIADPSKMQNDADPQLDAAIAQMLSELEKNPYRPPSRPAYPDRRGMGIRAEDK